MATKTFKLGEWCQGGNISVDLKFQTKDERVLATVWITVDEDIHYFEITSKREPLWKTLIEIELCEYTTSYYAGKVVEWINSKI